MFRPAVVLLLTIIIVNSDSNSIYISENSSTHADFFETYRGKYPILFKGLTVEEWPDLATFKSRFGKAAVKFASESSIVFSNGHAHSITTIDKLIHDTHDDLVRKYSVAFDVSIDKSIPDMENYFSVPGLLRPFHDKVSRHVSSVLSIGRLNSGLPFHSHGEAWLGLVGGRKRWFVYPPGMHLSAEVQQKWHPYQALDVWTAETLTSYHVANPEEVVERMEGVASTAVPGDTVMSCSSCGISTICRSEVVCSENVPLQCDQQTGDVMYLPAGWSHMTLNTDLSGPTVGVGGQAVWLSSDRKMVCEEVLMRRDPANYECLKSLATALITEAMSKHMGSGAAGSDMATTCAQLERAVRLLRNATRVRPLHPDGHLALVDVMLKLCTNNMCQWSACTNQGATFLPQKDDVKATIEDAEIAIDNTYAASTLRGSGANDKIMTPEDVKMHHDDCDRDEYDMDGIATAYHRLSSAIAAQFPNDAIRLLQKSLTIQKNNMKGISQLMLLFKGVGNIEGARSTLAVMETYTPGHDMIARMKALL